MVRPISGAAGRVPAGSITMAASRSPAPTWAARKLRKPQPAMGFPFVDGPPWFSALSRTSNSPSMVGTMAARNQAHPSLLAVFRPRPRDLDGQRSQPVLARRALARLGGALQDGRGIAQRARADRERAAPQAMRGGGKGREVARRHRG